MSTTDPLAPGPIRERLEAFAALMRDPEMARVTYLFIAAYDDQAARLARIAEICRSIQAIAEEA